MPSLIAILGLNGSSFKAGLNQAVNQARTAGDKIGSSLGSELQSRLLGFATIAGVEELIRRTMEFASQVSNLSARLGISEEAVQEWDLALRLADSDMQSAAPIFEKWAVARQKALEGNKEMIAAFKELGVSIDDLKKKRLEDIGLQMASAFETGDPQKLIVPFKEVGGRGAGMMAAAFRKGLPETIAEIRKMGAVMPEATIESIHETEHWWVKSWAWLKAKTGEQISALSYRKEQIRRNLEVSGAGFVGFLRGGKEESEAAMREVIDRMIEADAKVEERRKRAKEHLVGGGDEDLAAAQARADAAKKAADEEAARQLRIQKLKEDLFKKQRENDRQGLLAEEQIEEVLKRRAAILSMMNRMDQEHRLIAANDLEDLAAEEERIWNSIPAPEKTKGAGPLDVNQLQKIGAYARNPIQDSQLAEARTQTRIMTAMDRKLQELNRKQDGVGY